MSVFKPFFFTYLIPTSLGAILNNDIAQLNFDTNFRRKRKKSVRARQWCNDQQKILAEQTI